MNASFSRFEISRQQLAGSETAHDVLAPSRPLYELATQAPSIDDMCDFQESPAYPFANDAQLTYYFHRMLARTLTPEYQAARNRVAIVVGESGLAANLKFIPEETIILADRSPLMCQYMTSYVKGLQQGGSVSGWMEEVDTFTDAKTEDHAMRQAADVYTSGYGNHPLFDDDAFVPAATIANEKALIPWCIDLAEPDETRQLGDALRRCGATVTFMNLTNIIQFSRQRITTEDVAIALKELPMTSQAPILTSSAHARESYRYHKITIPTEDTAGVGATGPFFGVDNLAAHGGKDDLVSAGAVIMRQVVPMALRQ